MSGGTADIVGLVGSAVFIAAYAYATFGAAPQRLALGLANLIGAVLLLTSLSIHFNLAAFVLESVWGMIALAGVVAELVRRRRAA